MFSEFINNQNVDYFFIGLTAIVSLWVGLKLLRLVFQRSAKNQVKKLVNITPNHQLAIVTVQDQQYTLLLHKQGGAMLDKKQVGDKATPHLDLSRRNRNSF